jgi:cysteinyl-tRNA synthetase
VWHAYESTRTGPSADEAARIEGLIAERAAARKAKDFAKGDVIRNALEAEGIKLIDGAGGTTWERMR